MRKPVESFISDFLQIQRSRGTELLISCATAVCLFVFFWQVWRMRPSSLTWRLSFTSHTSSWPSRCLFTLSHTDTYYINTAVPRINTARGQLWWRNVEYLLDLWRTVGRGEGGREGWYRRCAVKIIALRWSAMMVSRWIPALYCNCTSLSKHTHFPCVSWPILLWDYDRKSLRPLSHIITVKMCAYFLLHYNNN